jgi:hypothetical protein
MRTTVLLCLMLLACLALPHSARADGTASISSLFAFDPGLGKQRELSAFTWPTNQKLCVALRFETSGYDSRKTVELFLSLTNRKGEVLRKYSAQLSLAAGEHEYVMPEVLRLEEMFISDRIMLDGGVKLVGGEREGKQVEVVLNGPALPRMTIDGLKLVDPKTGKPLKGVQPGQKFKIVGAVGVAGNSTKLLPSLTVWGVMKNDSLKSDPWTQDQFSDSFWDRATLNGINGKWRFEIEAQAPEYFAADAPGSQPFMINVAVEFTRDVREVVQLGGTVNSGKSAFKLHKDMELRLIRLERNWHWDVKTMK